MADQFVGEVRLVAFNFAPKGWALTAGQLMPISQNTALFSLLGTYYGGDGKSTFALPNLEGSVAMGQGQGAGLSAYFIGEQSGTSTVTLIDSEVPIHTHQFMADSRPADVISPSGSALATTAAGTAIYFSGTGTKTQLNPSFISPYGGGQPHDNMMPYLTLNWVIALQGIFPARS